MRGGVVLVSAFLVGGCGPCGPPSPRPDGGSGSSGSVSVEGAILAGAARRSVAPRGFEIPNPRYLTAEDCDPVQLTESWPRCGTFPTVLDDCGRDGICPGDARHLAPDVDGTERDGKHDFFLDCGTDRLCPGNTPELDDPTTPADEATNGMDDDGDGATDDGTYPGPDSDGTEGDEAFQAAWIAGYGNNRPALGIHDDIDVRCLALRVEGTTAVVCSLDVVGLFHNEVERARALLPVKRPDLHVDYLAVAGSHTHESVDTIGQWGRADPVPSTPGRLPGHNAFVVAQIVDAAAAAVDALAPAELHLFHTTTGREGFLHDGRVPFIFDDSVNVVEARARDGTTIFTVVNWGNHPEVLGDRNNLLSSDFVSPLRDAVEGGLPATTLRPAFPGRGGMTIFLNGTVGGLMAPLHVDFVARDGTPRPDSSRTHARTRDYGELLADKVLEVMQGQPLQTVTRAALAIRSEELFIPVDNPIFTSAFRLGIFDREAFDEATGQVVDSSQLGLGGITASIRTEVFFLALGPWRMAGVPGEMFPESAVGVDPRAAWACNPSPTTTAPRRTAAPPASPPSPVRRRHRRADTRIVIVRRVGCVARRGWRMRRQPR
ncbi:MAG: hypothetical protein AB2A00_23640 [Myxococcota bacterium]